MAKVYSAVCWGGLAGKSVTVSSSTDLVTLTNHGLRDGKGVAFASGTLPTVSGAALSLGTTYYAKSTAANTFELYYDQALTSKIDFTNNGSSLVMKSALLLGLSSAQLARYGASGSERIYDSMLSAYTARSTAALGADDEVIEVIEAFDSVVGNLINTNGFPAASLKFTSMVNGVRGEAFHGGVLSGGFRHISTNSGAGSAITVNSYNVTIDGIEFCHSSASAMGAMVQFGTNGYNIEVANNIFRQIGTGATGGVNARGACRIYNNILVDLQNSTGAVVMPASLALGSEVFSNLVTRCNVGFVAGTSAQGIVYNNLSVGNTVDWSGAPSATPTRAVGNIGSTSSRVNFTATSGSSSLTMASAAALNLNQAIFLSSTGTLPTVSGVPLSSTVPYFVKTVSGTTLTISATSGGTTLTFDGAGSGTHTISLVWATSAPPVGFIDFTTPGNVFVDWSNGDFRPAGYGTATPGSQALQVDSAVDFGVELLKDILGKERPQWRNGAPEYKDVGAFEMDFGYGPRPASHTLTLDNVVVGSRILIESQNGLTQHYNDVAATSSVEVTIQVYGDARDNWRIRIRKASASPYYRPWSTLMTATAGESAIYVEQQLDE